jgi:hypothetical protein
MIIAKEPEGKGFEKPEGTFQAVCYSVWDIGMQKSVFAGEEKRQHKIIIAWEIDKLIETEGQYKGKRFVVTNKYTLSLHEKSLLRKHLESWKGKGFSESELKGFDIEKLIGVNCILNIIKTEKNGKTYTNIAAIMPCMKGTIPLKPENSTTPPEWVKKLQHECEQPAPVEEPEEFPMPENIEDIPF